MKRTSCEKTSTQQKNGKHEGSSDPSRSPREREITQTHQPGFDLRDYPTGYEIRVICIYPTIDGGKLAKRWIESAFSDVSPFTSTCIEYYNYAVLSHDGISWPHVIERIHPDIIVMIGDGGSQLLPGFRHSLKELISRSSTGKKPLVIFRDLDPQPTLNTSVLLDYVSALTNRNHCEFNAMNGDGTPIHCFRHPRFLLKARRHHE
jgi:hypothetical protein